MSEKVERRDNQIPCQGFLDFDQVRLLFLWMAAIKGGDRERVEKIRIEAEALGFKMGPGNNVA